MPVSRKPNLATTENTTTINPALNNEIAKPTVTIVNASNVIPVWTDKEDISGNYPILSGLYVGAIGQKPIKIILN